MSNRLAKKNRYTVTVSQFEKPGDVVVQIDEAGKNILTLAGAKATKFLQANGQIFKDLTK